MKRTWDSSRDPLAALREGDPSLFEAFVAAESPPRAFWWQWAWRRMRWGPLANLSCSPDFGSASSRPSMAESAHSSKVRQAADTSEACFLRPPSRRRGWSSLTAE